MTISHSPHTAGRAESFQTIRNYGRDEARVALPMPPSTNNMFVNVAGKGRVRSQEYKGWAKAAGWIVKAQRIRKFDVPVTVRIEVNNPRGLGFDIDNRIKAVLDILVSTEVIVDDSAKWVRGIEIKVMDSGAECVVVVEAIQ